MAAKKFLGYFVNFVLLSLLALTLYRQIPMWLNSFEKEGSTFESQKVITLAGEEASIPTLGKKQVFIFWATWCGPCKKQIQMMEVLNKEGAIYADSIVLVNLGESPDTVRKYLDKFPSSYKTVLSPVHESWQKFDVKATPTILFVDSEQTITYATAGLSPMINNKIKDFLN